jgi:hypothetical protein
MRMPRALNAERKDTSGQAVRIWGRTRVPTGLEAVIPEEMAPVRVEANEAGEAEATGMEVTAIPDKGPVRLPAMSFLPGGSPQRQIRRKRA